MRYAINLPITGVDGDVNRLVEFAQLAEQAGWDGIFLEDYIVYYGEEPEITDRWESVGVGATGVTPVFDPWIVMAAIAAHTRRIRLGTMVTPLARRRPWKVARETVTLDYLSNGRLILGVGVGDSADRSFRRFGEEPDPKNRSKKLDEALDVIAGLWTGNKFTYTGEYFRVDGVTFLPTPVQRPRIPIWVGGGWPRKSVVERAARWDGACFYKVLPDGQHALPTPSDIAELRSSVEKHRAATTPFDIAIGGMTRGSGKQADGEVRAFSEAGATWWSEFAPQNSSALRKRIELGPPAF